MKNRGTNKSGAFIILFSVYLQWGKKVNGKLDLRIVHRVAATDGIELIIYFYTATRAQNSNETIPLLVLSS